MTKPKEEQNTDVSVVLSHTVMSNLMEHCYFESEYFRQEGEAELAEEFKAASDRLHDMAHMYCGEYVISMRTRRDAS